jgi:hypothetical protein
MASELRVNTLKDAAGANSVAMEYVAGGSSKAWVQLNGSTFAIAGSFNVSSADDNGTGDYDINYTNSMNTNTYAVPASCNGDGSGYNRAISINAVATGSHDIITFVTDTANIKSDLDIISTAIHGDLA